VTTRSGRLGAGGEFDRLRAIFTRLGPAARDLGDDCALVRVGGRTLAISIDLSLEGVHFRTDWLSFREIGWRATAAALSDLAAEGATPFGVLVSLGMPGDRQRRSGNASLEIMSGAGAAARHVGAHVLGGDLVRSPRYLVDVCALGLVARPLRRSGARPGDGVWVSGRLGGPGLALSTFEAGGRRLPVATRRRFTRPVPRIAAGRWLAGPGRGRAMIDISDGLAGDAGHLAAASGVAIVIELERVPCWPGVTPRDAVRSGEEYELLVALPRGFGEGQARAFRRFTGLPLTRIGRCTRGRGIRMLDHGRRIPPPPGFDQFPIR
jgi:thiamine-monophosphate kinase